MLYIDTHFLGVSLLGGADFVFRFARRECLGVLEQMGSRFGATLAACDQGLQSLEAAGGLGGLGTRGPAPFSSGEPFSFFFLGGGAVFFFCHICFLTMILSVVYIIIIVVYIYIYIRHQPCLF